MTFCVLKSDLICVCMCVWFFVLFNLTRHREVSFKYSTDDGDTYLTNIKAIGFEKSNR